MVTTGPGEQAAPLPEDLEAVTTTVQETPEGTLYKDPAEEVIAEPEGTVSELSADGSDKSQESGTADRLYEQPGFKEFQSKTDQQINELRGQLEQEQARSRQAEQQASLNTTDQQVATWAQQQYQALLERGVDDQTAQEITNQQATLAKQAYLAQQGSNTAETKLNAQVRQARAYELATQNGIQYSELAAIEDPSYMEQHAKTLGRVRELEQRLQGSAPGQQFDTSQPATDVAPSDDTRILDAYAAGDDRISLDQAKAAAGRLGMRIF